MTPTPAGKPWHPRNNPQMKALKTRIKTLLNKPRIPKIHKAQSKHNKHSKRTQHKNSSHTYLVVLTLFLVGLVTVLLVQRHVLHSQL